MAVRNENLRTFRNLTPEERNEIVEAVLQGAVQYFSFIGSEWESAKPTDNLILLDGIYRTHPRQLVIPWEVFRPEYKWAAMDFDGGVYFFSRRPSLSAAQWLPESGSEVMRADYLLVIETTGIDWRESLTERP